MLFSVITIGRNNLAGLQKTGASLAAQEHENIEWIVLELSSKGGKFNAPPSLLTIHINDFTGSEEDAARHALSIAKGRYVLFLRPHEVLAQTQTLQKIKNSVEFTQADLVYGDYWHLGKGRTKYKSAQSHTKAQNGLFTCPSSILYSRMLIEKMLYHEQSARKSHPRFILRAIEFSQTILYLPIAISAGNFSDSNTTARFGASAHRKIQIIQLLNWGMFHAPPRLYRKLIPPLEAELPLQL